MAPRQVRWEIPINRDQVWGWVLCGSSGLWVFLVGGYASLICTAFVTPGQHILVQCFSLKDPAGAAVLQCNSCFSDCLGVLD